LTEASHVFEIMFTKDYKEASMRSDKPIYLGQFDPEVCDFALR
jgi:hypothetical protein